MFTKAATAMKHDPRYRHALDEAPPSVAKLVQIDRREKHRDKDTNPEDITQPRKEEKQTCQYDKRLADIDAHAKETFYRKQRWTRLKHGACLRRSPGSGKCKRHWFWICEQLN